MADMEVYRERIKYIFSFSIPCFDDDDDDYVSVVILNSSLDSNDTFLT